MKQSRVSIQYCTKAKDHPFVLLIFCQNNNNSKHKVLIFQYQQNPQYFNVTTFIYFIYFRAELGWNISPTFVQCFWQLVA